MVYVFTPVMLSQLIMTLNGPAHNFLRFFLINFLKLFIVLLIIIIIYIIVHIATTITKVNQSIPKYLYPVFVYKSFSRLNHHVGFSLSYKTRILSDIIVKMKIDSFIAKLNEEYVGFYCFNLFKITKLVMLQYC